MLKLYYVLLILGITFSNVENGFEQVIANTTEEVLKHRLVQFKENGIELLPNKTDFDKNKLIEIAYSYLKTPHKMGGCTREGIDCSGLVMAAHKELGVLLPHSAHEQARFGTIIPSMEELIPGDMVFFYNSYNTNRLITHSGIYIGDGMFIHTSNSKGVVVTPVNDPYYWGKRFLFGTRIE